MTMSVKKRKYISVILALFVTAFTYQGTRSVIFFSVGLDPSWQYALNMFNYTDVKFGRDVVFTYGPLGFLIKCLSVGDNIAFSLIFWAVFAAAVFVLLYLIIFNNSGSKSSMIRVSIGLFLYLMCFSVRHYAYPLTEYYTVFWFAASLLMSANPKYDRKIIFVSDAILAVGMFMKFSMVFEMLSCAVLMFIAMLIVKHKEKFYVLIHTASACLTAIICYLIFYDHSVTDLFNYIRGSLEYSRGYNYAMSFVSHYDNYLWMIIALAILYVICTLINMNNKMNVIMFFSLAGPSFFFYKHGFVRAEKFHIILAFVGFLAIISIMFFFFDLESENEMKLKKPFNKKPSRLIMISFAVCAALSVEVVLRLNVTDLFYGSINDLTDLERKIADKDEAHIWDRENTLPDKMTDIIGDDTVAIYPVNIMYDMSNDLNYVPLYGLQAYGIYTPWLDEKTAEKFEVEDKPEHIILEMDSIDNRWVFLDTPLTWRAIKNNYYIEYYEDGKFLLNQRESALSGGMTLMQSESANKNDSISIPENCGSVKISAKLNLLGNAMALMYRIPPVAMTVTYKNGMQETHRVILQNFVSGVDLSSIVNDENQLVDYLNNNGESGRVESVKFSGDGLKYFGDALTVEFYDLNERSETHDLDSYHKYAERIDFSDISGSVADKLPTGCGECRAVVIDGETHIKGWAYDSAHGSDGFDEIYLRSGDSLYKLKPTVRKDVEYKFSLSGNKVGFTALIDKEISDFSFVARSRNGNYYEIGSLYSDVIFAG